MNIAWSMLLLVMTIVIPLIMVLIIAFIYRRYSTYIRVTIFNGDGTQKIRLLHESKTKTSYNNVDYLIKPEGIYHKGIRRYIYFFKNNPTPLTFDDKGNLKEGSITGEELNGLMRENILRVFTKTKRRDEIILYVVLLFSIISSLLTIANYGG